MGKVCYGGLAGIVPSAYSKIFAVGGSAKMSASEINVRVPLRNQKSMALFKTLSCSSTYCCGFESISLGDLPFFVFFVVVVFFFFFFVFVFVLFFVVFLFLFFVVFVVFFCPYYD